MKNALIKKPGLAIAMACLIAMPMFAQNRKASSSENSTSTVNRSRVESRVDHRVDYLATVLSLTNSQKRQAKQIFTAAANENSAVLGNLRTERQDLRNAVDTNQPSGTIKGSSDAIGNNVAKLVVNLASASEQFRNILNPEQRTKFTQLQREAHGLGMGMAFYGARPLAD